MKITGEVNNPGGAGHGDPKPLPMNPDGTLQVAMAAGGSLGAVSLKDPDGNAVDLPNALGAGGGLKASLVDLGGAALDATLQAVRDRLPAAFGTSGGVKASLVDLAGAALDASVLAVRDRLPAAFTSGGGVKAGLVDALPAGTNVIGKTDIIERSGSGNAWTAHKTALVATTGVPVRTGATWVQQIKVFSTLGSAFYVFIIDATSKGSFGDGNAIVQVGLSGITIERTIEFPRGGYLFSNGLFIIASQNATSYTDLGSAQLYAGAIYATG